MEYIVFHPWRVVFAVIVGVILGVGSFYAYQAQATFDAMAVEQFDPEGARLAIEATQTPVDQATFVEPSEFEPRGQSDLVDISAEMADIRELMGNASTFDPRAFSPNSFGEPIPDSEFVSYLLVGNDASGFLADVIILALQPSHGGKPIMVSLPRDLYVWNVCKGTFTRLNAGLGGCSGTASGMEMMALLVEDYTGIRIDHMARINFAGFAAMVDAMGGTTICVDYPSRDAKSGLDIPDAGCQTANGATTLAWVRSRHTEQLIEGEWVQVVGSDYVRQAREQDVLFQLAARASGFSSPAGLVAKLNTVAASLRLDSSWSFAEAVSTAWRYRGITKTSVSRFSIKTKDYRTPGGSQVLLPRQSFKTQLSTVYSLG